MAVPTAGFLTEGFDGYNGIGGAGSTSVGVASRWSFSGAGSAGLASGFFGGQALFLNSSGTQIHALLGLGPSRAAFAIGALVTFYIGGSDLIPFFGPWQTSAQIAVCGQQSGAGALVVTSGTTQTALGTSPTGIFLPGSTHYIEMIGVIASGSGGSFSVYLDGALVLTVTGVNTAPNGSGYSALFAGGLNNSSGTVVVDEMYFNPAATPLGPMRCPMLRPTSNAAVAWTPLTGTNWGEVSETLCDGDTSYVSSATVGASDLYDMGSLPTVPAQIFGATVVMFSRATDANPRSIYPQIQSGPTLEQGAAINLGPTYGYQSRVDLVDPNTGIAWGATAINAVQVGPALAA